MNVYFFRMQTAGQVSRPPEKPILIYDGECGFCARWIRRVNRMTGDRVEYLPYQSSSVAARFPEVPVEQFETAVQLILSSGVVVSGAEAVLSCLNVAARAGWLLRWYRKSTLFARTAEWLYQWIARNRRWLSALTRKSPS